MDLDALQEYLRSKPETSECLPYGAQTLVYKLGDEVFALLSWQDSPVHLTLRCDPDRALRLRDMYDAVRPSTFMNRRNWNTISLDGSLDEATIFSMIDNAFELVQVATGSSAISHG